MYLRKTNGDGQALATSRFSGAIAGGFVSRAWMPAWFHTFASGISSAGISLAVDAGVNVLREFWPEIRHPRRRLNEARAQAMAMGQEPEMETRAEIEVVELDAGDRIRCSLAQPSN